MSVWLRTCGSAAVEDRAGPLCTPAREDLHAILIYVAERAGVDVALGFVSRLRRACDDLATAPLRGTARDDLRPGLRTVGIERRATILFYVQDDDDQVVILGVLYGGRDLEAIMRQPGRTD